jgi:hypothetical protein
MVKSRRMVWAGHVACMVIEKMHTGFLVGKLKRNRPLGRRKLTLEDNIKTGRQEVKWGAWTGLMWFWKGARDGQL